ncbi:MAG: hypothetical protein JSS02_15650 [Planctomycetes bacterium]|nr:hypothetical protein [Planctomycetota bacterium]
MAHSIPVSSAGYAGSHLSRRLKLTISTMACLWGLFSGYTLLFSPLFSPRIEIVDRVGDKVTSETDRGRLTEERRQAETYLPGQPWAAEEKKGYHFRTDSGYFFVRNWDNQVDDGKKVRFTPFAMIWRPKGHDPAKAPYTIVSSSAVVAFTKKFEVSNPNPGRVVGGALEGDVQIRGPDGLGIDGQHFYFGEQVQRIWSDHAIHFQHGLNSGRATGIELDLISHPRPETVETLAVTGIRTVRLRKAVEMSLYPSSGTPETPGEPVLVKCQGAFEYDVLNYLAKFEKEVWVRQSTGNNQMDELKCDTLTLVFERDAEEAGTPPPNPETAQTGFETKLKFRRLLAEGPKVTISSQRSNMHGWMTSLNYDEQSRVIALSDARQVRLLQADNEVLCPEITVLLDEAKKDVESVECRGSGQLYRYARGTDQKTPSSKKQRELSATWQRVLKMAPDPQTGLDLIEIEGHAELKRIGALSLEADIIGIWVTRSRNEIDRSPGGKVGDVADNAVRPRKMLALKDVHFGSPQIGGQTESLAVWFEDGKLPRIPVTDVRQSSLQNRDANGDLDESASAGLVVGRTNRKQIRTPSGRDRDSVVIHETALQKPARTSAKKSTGRTSFAAVEAGQSAPRSTDGKNRSSPTISLDADDSDLEPASEPKAASPTGKQRSQPLHVVAEQIQVRALQDGDEDPQVAEVVTEGRVHIQQEHAKGERPLDVKGDKLLLWNYGDSNQILEVFGAPAHVQDRQLQLKGPDIRFDRIANRATVKGPGELLVPVPKGMDGKPLSKPELLQVTWKEKMEFDGRLAKFFSDVHSKLSGSDMRCEEMDVMFTRRISFAEDSRRDQEVDIQSLVCRDGVDLRSYEYEGTVLVGVRKARGYEFKFNRTTGVVTSQGGGGLEIWSLEGGKRDKKRTDARVDNMRAREVAPGVWKYTRILFDGTMRGNTNEQSTTFRDVKQVVYGTVANSTEAIDDIENLPKDGGWMKCQELTLTHVPETKSTKAHVEMKATGNVALEGQSFNALAHQVSYDQSKGQYIISGDGTQDATIYREGTRGGRRSSQSAQLMRFTPAENAFSIDRGSGGEANR